MNNSTNTRKYSWQEIQEYITPLVDKSDAILTFGTIGSTNVEHDVDIIITKKPEAKTSDFYKQLHSLFESINQYLQHNYGQKAVRFSCMSHQEEVLGLGNYQNGDLALHVMLYHSLPQMIDDWTPSLGGKESAEKIVLSSYKPIKGAIDDVLSGEFSTSRKYDNLFIQLYNSDRFNSNIPESMLVDKVNHLSKYLLKHCGLVDESKSANIEDARKKFYNLCDILDEKNNGG